MSNYLTSLYRPSAPRSNSSPRKPRTSTLAIRRLSLVPEEDEATSSSSRAPSPAALAVPSPKAPNSKRLSRYGKATMLGPLALSSDDDFTFERPRPAPRPPKAAARTARQSVRLSTFDFEIPATTSTKKERRLSRLPEGSQMVAFRPPSPTLSSASDVDISCSDSVRLSVFPFDLPTGFEFEAPARAASPAGSISSSYTSASGTSTDLPLTPTSSDDEWPMPAESRKSDVPAVPIRPLVINKSARKLPTPVSHDEHEDDATWYSRELGIRFELVTPPLNATFPRTDALDSSPKPAPVSLPRSRHSKPLPALPLPSTNKPTPSAQLDPTFPTARPMLPSSPPPAHLRRRKHLTITVPRPPPQRPIPADVGDIFDDGAAWGPAPVSSTAGSATLSPPRLPESPFSAHSARVECEEPLPTIVYDQETETPDVSVEEFPTVPTGPVPEIIVSALEQPVQEAAPLAQTQEPEFSFNDDEDVPETDGSDRESRLLRSRWSSSTLSSLAAADAPSVLSPRMLSFHIGNVARRVVRTKRTSAGGKSIRVEVQRPFEVQRPSLERAYVTPRQSIESLNFSPRSSYERDDGASESGDSTSSNGLRRKAIPVELFMR